MAVTLNAEETYGSLKKIKWTFTSDTAGDASGATTTLQYNGEAALFVSVPSTTTPDTNFDVEVLDEDGLDVLAGGGANQPVTTKYTQGSSLGVAANDKLYLSVTNAGNAKTGSVYLYLR